MAIADQRGKLIAVSDSENPEIFIGYYIHAILVTADAGYKIDSYELVRNEGSLEEPHQVIIHYSIQEEANIKELQSYAVETIDVSTFGIPHPDPESGIVEPTQYIETRFTNGEPSTVVKSTTNTGRMAKLHKGGKVTQNGSVG